MQLLGKLLRRKTEEPQSVELKFKDFKGINMSKFPGSVQTGYIFHIEVDGDAREMEGTLDKLLREATQGDEQGLGTADTRGTKVIQISVPDVLAPRVRELLTAFKPQTSASYRTERESVALVSVITGVSNETEENRRVDDPTHHFAHHFVVELDQTRVREGQLADIARQMEQILDHPVMCDVIKGKVTGKVRWVTGTKSLLVEVTSSLDTAELSAIGKAVSVLVLPPYNGSNRGFKCEVHNLT